MSERRLDTAEEESCEQGGQHSQKSYCILRNRMFRTALHCHKVLCLFEVNISKIKKEKPGVVAHDCSPSTWEAEAKGVLQRPV